MDVGGRRRDNAAFAEYVESAEKRKAPALEGGRYKGERDRRSWRSLDVLPGGVT
jgi:hypothetical protein